MASLKTSSFGNAIRRGSLKNTLIALYKFKVGQTIHISYESIFGGPGDFLEAGTMQVQFGSVSVEFAFLCIGKSDSDACHFHTDA